MYLYLVHACREMRIHCPTLVKFMAFCRKRYKSWIQHQVRKRCTRSVILGMDDRENVFPLCIGFCQVNCVATRAAKSFACASRELCRLYTIVDIPDSFKVGTGALCTILAHPCVYQVTNCLSRHACCICTR